MEQVTRTKAEVDQEYTQIATLYGDRLFRISNLQAEAKELFEKLSNLNLEAGRASGAIPPLPIPSPKEDEPLIPTAEVKSVRKLKKA